jgi:hypothetical protein
MLPQCVELARGDLVPLDQICLGKPGAHVFSEAAGEVGR